MKCSGCGAEIPESAKFCEYCGSQISYDMRREQEQLNKVGCPKCHSSNIQFKRENQGEVRGKKSKRVIHRTVGFCKDCGYTWYPDSASGAINGVPEKSNLKWWVLGWIFFFPAPVMILIWRKKNTWDIKIKIAVTVAFWLFILIYGSFGNREDSKPTYSSSKNTSITEESDLGSKMNNMTDDAARSDVVEKEANEYAEDDIVNRFISDYNATSKYEMTDVSKGNIRTKYFGHTNDCYVEMINATEAAAEAFCVTINGGNNEDITEKMLTVFPEVVHVIDSSISDEQIQQAISDFKNGNVISEGYKLGDSMTITYIPLKFRDDGSWLSNSRIDISSNAYGK